MVVHIVMFKFKEENREANILEAQDRLNSLIEFVPSLDTIEIGIDFDKSQRAMDLVLTATFKDKNALEDYAIDKSHLEVVEFMKSVTEYSKVVDYQK
ncbi:Stress responsive alpha-beta barrel domain protein Dabb [hydrothermal vent metagenome]|uniref:Stress responsive alpha-beta barrel domain protein Dabb n=1 Tax=hydrothermal vent metagenome TaxID=652676 RepID=A0A1W1EKL2_9ZZZZ